MPFSDRQIQDSALGVGGVMPPRGPLISPFEPEQVRKMMSDHVPEPIKAISFGLSSYGYDFRLSAMNCRILRDQNHSIIDPKNFDQNLLEAIAIKRDLSGSYFILPANCYALAETEEWVNMPEDVTAIGFGKSTYARCGIIINVTPLEAGWSGKITLEIANLASVPIKLYAHEGICQFIFLHAKERCLVAYSERSGKYHNQEGLTTARI